MTAKGCYDISIENLFEPPKREIIKKPKRKDLSYIEANTNFEYKNGRLYWKVKPKYGGIVVGQLAGSKSGLFLKVTLNKTGYMQHRVVYLLHHRRCPELITFIDKTLTDEGVYDISIENLKVSTFSHIGSVSNYN